MRKKMIEVAIPLDAINRESAREKSIRHGHPSTLHLWWARRPLAACRAVIFTSLVDDPDSDPANHSPSGTIDTAKAQARRRELFRLIEELVKWENANDDLVLNRARAEIAASFVSEKVFDDKTWKTGDSVCGSTVSSFLSRTASPEAVNSLLAEHVPPFLDPFCGGGSIPLEAHRLGLRAYASDLNPVPVLINKALVEIPARYAGRTPINPDDSAVAGTKTRQDAAPNKRSRQKGFVDRVWRGGEGLAADVRYYGKWMRDEAAKQIGHLYPPVTVTASMATKRPELEPYVGQTLPVIAWLWARTIECPNPSCRARTPLVRSFWLSQKPGSKCHVQPECNQVEKSVRFSVSSHGDAPAHTSDRTGARCLFCGTVIKKQQLREIACARGITELPLAVVAEGPRGRVYFGDEAFVPVDIPPPDIGFLEHPITDDKRWFSPPLYGLRRFADLFTRRQATALVTLCGLLDKVGERVREDARRHESVAVDGTKSTSVDEYADAIATYLAFAIDKVAEGSTTLCTWSPLPTKLHVVSTFGRQAMPMVWDFAEANVFADSSGNFERMVGLVCEVLERLPVIPVRQGTVAQADATMIESSGTPFAISTDPPYYDNIGYADLSDFAYVWLRRSLGEVYPQLLRTVLTPKTEELIAATHRHRGSREAAKTFFVEGLGRAFKRACLVQHDAVPLTVYYAFKQSETDEGGRDDDGEDATASVASTGWETMLEGLLKAGFIVDGTWPMRTERSGGFRNLNQNALASSIVLVCRKRAADAPVASRRDFVTALKRELPSALRELQAGNIAPVDLAQATIGPGMAVYSRYSKVLEGSGEPLTVRTALALINQVLDEVLAEQEGDYDADTRWSLKWFEQFAHDDAPFGDANTLATAMSIGINGLVETGIVQAKSGKVRLLKRTELMGGHPETWDPATDTDIVHWEVCQYLIHALDTKGEAGAAALLRRINARYPGAAETARELAYRLYTICERKKWAQEAMAYNSLIVAWPEIVKLAQSSDSSGDETQTTLF